MALKKKRFLLNLRIRIASPTCLDRPRLPQSSSAQITVANMQDGGKYNPVTKVIHVEEDEAHASLGEVPLPFVTSQTAQRCLV